MRNNFPKSESPYGTGDTCAIILPSLLSILALDLLCIRHIVSCQYQGSSLFAYRKEYKGDQLKKKQQTHIKAGNQSLLTGLVKWANKINPENNTGNSLFSCQFLWLESRQMWTAQRLRISTLPICASLTHLVKDIKQTKHKHFIHESSFPKPKALMKGSRCDSPAPRNTEWETTLYKGVST